MEGGGFKPTKGLLYSPQVTTPQVLKATYILNSSFFPMQSNHCEVSVVSCNTTPNLRNGRVLPLPILAKNNEGLLMIHTRTEVFKQTLDLCQTTSVVFKKGLQYISGPQKSPQPPKVLSRSNKVSVNHNNNVSPCLTYSAGLNTRKNYLQSSSNPQPKVYRCNILSSHSMVEHLWFQTSHSDVEWLTYLDWGWVQQMVPPSSIY